MQWLRTRLLRVETEVQWWWSWWRATCWSEEQQQPPQQQPLIAVDAEAQTKDIEPGTAKPLDQDVVLETANLSDGYSEERQTAVVGKESCAHAAEEKPLESKRALLQGIPLAEEGLDDLVGSEPGTAKPLDQDVVLEAANVSYGHSEESQTARVGKGSCAYAAEERSLESKRALLQGILLADEGLHALVDIGLKVMSLFPQLADEKKLSMRVFAQVLAHELVGKAAAVKANGAGRGFLTWVVQKAMQWQEEEEDLEGAG